MLAGELHNSSASSIEYMEPIWNKLDAMHLNISRCAFVPGDPTRVTTF
jgi:hypothetical protein